MSEEPLFPTSLKKKKKKKTVAFNEDPLGADADPTYVPPLSPKVEAIEEITVHEQMKAANGSAKKEIEETKAQKEKEEEDFLDSLGDFKKKKNKKKIPMDLGDTAETPYLSAPVDEESAATAAAPAAASTEEPLDADFDLSDLKKKKKSSKKKAALDLQAFEQELSANPGAGDANEDGIEGEEGNEDFVVENDEELGENPFAADASAAVNGTAGGAGGLAEGQEPWAGSQRDYKYNELLTRFFTMLHAANPALANNMGKRYTIAPPQILREGNKKSIFANIPDICRRMHRQPEHVIAFMLAEMGTTGSVDGSGRLVIKGRFLQKQVENVLRRYIVEYVTCKTCKSPDTILTKENRIYFLACESCGSRRSVSAIKSGFQAQVGKRSKNKTG